MTTLTIRRYWSTAGFEVGIANKWITLNDLAEAVLTLSSSNVLAQLMAPQQIVVYPVTDMTMSEYPHSNSRNRFC